MATFCVDDCEAICDFCKYYKDEYEGTDKFAGEGVCEVDGSEVDACSGYDCDDFYCMRVDAIN